jgi:hypothetical protein
LVGSSVKILSRSRFVRLEFFMSQAFCSPIEIFLFC